MKSQNMSTSWWEGREEEGRNEGGREEEGRNEGGREGGRKRTG